MKHYMILETKKDKKYTIQYLKKTFFGLNYWKNLINTLSTKFIPSSSLIFIFLMETFIKKNFF